MLFSYHVEFFTATILRWQHLLANDQFKQLLVDSLAWLVQQGRCRVHGFVIMPNHIHLLWRLNERFARREVQGALLSFTAHRFKEALQESAGLWKHYVADADRRFQFWEREAMVKECWSEGFLLQKLKYIHQNPCQPHWQLAQTSEEYYWSSALFYHTGQSPFAWLTHFKD